MPSSASYYSGQRRHSRQRRLAAAECARRKESGASDPGAESSSSGVPFFLCADPSAMDSQSSPVAAAAPGDPLAFNATWSSVQPRHHHPHPSSHQRVPLLNSPDLQLRFLSPSDIPEVKRLCKEWFPIDYPDAWYSDITSNPKFFSMACVYHARIIGLVVAEIRDYFALAKEDSEILAPTFRSGTKIGYILSLGVVREYRKNGVASFLLDNLLSHLTSAENWDVRAVYLHVLTTNFPAIEFYERRGFRFHLFLPYYYNIKGKRKDGQTYVLYINGGHPPWGPFDYLVHCCKIVFLLNPWSLTRGAMRKANFAWLRLVAPRLRQIAQSSTAMFS